MPVATEKSSLVNKLLETGEACGLTRFQIFTLIDNKEKGLYFDPNKGEFVSKSELSRFAKAGSSGDCGHEVAGARRAGKFAPGNTCHTGTGVEESGPDQEESEDDEESEENEIDKESEDIKPTRGEMREAKREGTGKEAKVVMADGSETPKHILPNMIAPNWSDIKVSIDPESEVVATGRDPKGRPVTIYTKAYAARASIIKFARVTQMTEQHDKIAGEIQKARKNPETQEEADCAWLMQVQATRPGSDRDTKAQAQAYGATTLQARHIVVPEGGKGVYLRFVGKKGVPHSHLVRDPELAKMLVSRKEKAKDPKDKIFNTDDKKVRSFTKTLDGGGFKSKDFRTSAASRLAYSLVKANPKPSKDPKTHIKRIKEVAEKVSNLLGNRPAECLKSYIHPVIFSQWGPPA